MTHLTDDVQIILVLGLGGSLAALAVCRVKYGADWLEPWLTLTKVLGGLALAVVAVGEHEAIYAWWAAAPLLMSISVVSAFGWLVTRWILRRKSQDVTLDLELRSARSGSISHGKSQFLFYWGLASLALLLVSFVVAMTRVQ